MKRPPVFDFDRDRQSYRKQSGCVRILASITLAAAGCIVVVCVWQLLVIWWRKP